VAGGELENMKVRSLTRIALLALLALPLLVSGAGAAVISYDVTGFDAAGNPVSARADFFTGSGIMTVDLTNLLAVGAVKEIGQNVSGVQFTLSSGQSSGALNGTNGPNQEQTVAAGGQAGGLTNVAGNPTGWSLQNNVNNGLGNGIGLCVLCAGGSGPHTLIGGTPAGNYINADGTIAGSATNNPFFDNVLHFGLNVPGLQGTTGNPGDYVDSVFITFGTTQRTTLQAHCSILSCLPERHKTPEPSSLLLLGAGVLGLAGFSLRKQRNTK
jgi:PEP-CTERM motif